MNKQPLVETIKERCRVCYSCVRECPAKAIRIYGGQAEVIADRCIGCGNCVRVCTQHAKKVRSSIEDVQELLTSKNKVAACLAPSFPAEFYDIDYKKVIGMIRKLGFDYVTEVAFGADLVSQEYRNLLQNHSDSYYIATTCPAIVSYVEKFHPNLLKNLAPIASPMTACARALHQMYGEDIEIVFIGPCLAKKEEADREKPKKNVSEVLTFYELRIMLKEHNINPDSVELSEFDPPYAGKGSLYPIGRGMLQAADIMEDFMTNDIIATDGTKQFVQTIKEFEKSEHNVSLLELLCCNGCIMGSGMTINLAQFSRRGYISKYAQNRYKQLDIEQWEKQIKEFKNLNLTAEFKENDLRLPVPTKEELKNILEQKGKFDPKDELNCGACGYDTCIEHAIAIHKGLAESEMCLPYTIETLKKTTGELTQSYAELVNAKQALIQSEKLASLGRLAAGIAHELNNPLTGVLTYACLLLEELEKSNYKNDLQIIINETLRCRNIVRGLLDFARETKLKKEPANINNIIIESLAILERHINFYNIQIKKQLSNNIPDINLDVNQMKSVLNNLAENAAHAMPNGGILTIITTYDEPRQKIMIEISDTGVGISEENIGKIFDPFFTTKKAGKGTGLGLAVAYGIIERYNGSINVKSKIGEGTTFTIELPTH